MDKIFTSQKRYNLQYTRSRDKRPYVDRQPGIPLVDMHCGGMWVADEEVRNIDPNYISYAERADTIDEPSKQEPLSKSSGVTVTSFGWTEL